VLLSRESGASIRQHSMNRRTFVMTFGVVLVAPSAAEAQRCGNVAPKTAIVLGDPVFVRDAHTLIRFKMSKARASLFRDPETSENASGTDRYAVSVHRH
jgi:hypothetical protein